MSLTLLLYLTEIFHNIDIVVGTITGIFVISCILLSLTFMMTLDKYSEDKNNNISCILKKLSSKLWIILILIFIQILIPTRQTMYMMMATKYMSDSKLPSQVMEILDIKLQDILKDIKKDKK